VARATSCDLSYPQVWRRTGSRHRYHDVGDSIGGFLLSIEFLLLLILLPLAVAGRVLLGRHWQIEVCLGRRLLYDVDGGDWGQSRLVIADLVEQIRLGQIDPALAGPSRSQD